MKGILDHKGVNLNPLTNIAFSEEYKKLGKIWSQFPAYFKAKEIIKSITSNQVLLIVSGTGSGKTVLVPKFALHSLDYKGKLAITLPKQIIAKSAAEFAAKTLDVKLGEEVGYQYKGESRKSDKTKLLYATDGTIVARLLNDPLLQEFNGVIIDEAHERKVQIDFLMYLLKQTLKKRKDFKVIIMSATINADIFSNYFSKFKFKKIDIGSESYYPVESIFLKQSISYKNFLSYGIDIIKEITKKDPQADILFFITSTKEANDVCKKLEDKSGYCVEVYSGIDKKKQELAQSIDLYKEEGKYNHKIVVATNVAESSLTIDGIKYVIDSGLELKSFYDPKIRARKLDKVLITQAQAKQRLGRTGRTQPGFCYHLYTKDDFEQMQSYPEPDIRTSNISQECLRLLNVDFINNVNDLLKTFSDFIEPPRDIYINDSLKTLKHLHFIKDNNLTKLGELASTLNTEPEIALCFIISVFYECSYEIAKIYSMISSCRNNINALFITATDLLKNNNKLKSMENKIKQKYLQAKNKFKHSSGDHISLLRLYDAYYQKGKNKNTIDEWTYRHFLKGRTLRKAVKENRRTTYKIQQLKTPENKQIIDKHITKLGLKKNLEEPVENRILYCIYHAFGKNKTKKLNK